MLALIVGMVDLFWASMRPGRFCPGDRRARKRRSLRSESRFNEAGAILPRRSPQCRQPTSGIARFNEAGAILPRRCQSGDRVSDVFVASMRPGRFCPGDLRPRKKRLTTQKGFNEAGAILPRRFGLLWGVPRRIVRFNEAGAILPRRLGRSYEDRS